MSNLKSQIQISNLKSLIFNNFKDLRFRFEFKDLRFALIQLLLFFLFISIGTVQAVQPLNNKFGIHLAQPHLNEIQKVADLVNGNGGDWGYVTLVMQEDDRNHQKWQEIFDLLREFHLIPIIRLATKPEGENWKRSSKDDATSWAEFLNSLNWVVKNRYIVLFNEPNHGAEWGGEVDAKNYTEVSLVFAKKLKEKNPDFFIMLAGLDASAPSYASTYLDEADFLKFVIDSSAQFLSHENLPAKTRDLESEKIAPDSSINNETMEQLNNIFDFIDGLASHSYPNPGFSGSPWDTGRKSIRAYQWELEILKNLGVKKDLPVFITETGWIRGNEETITQNLKIAYENAWLPDDRVVAVTPFVYDYQGAPFLEFSWKKYQSEDFYQQYYAVKDLQKKKGEPDIIDTGILKLENSYNQLVASSNYRFHLKLKNTGQAIWDKKNNYELRITLRQSSVQANYENKKLPFEHIFSNVAKIKPFQEAEADLYIKTNSQSGKYKLSIELQKDKKAITKIDNWNIEIVPLPNLDFKADLYPRLKTTGRDFEIQIYDEKEGLIYKKSGISVKDGWGVIDAVQNIVLGKKYRVVLLKSYYLPRQDYVTFKRGANEIRFKRMYPLDFNPDGHFDWNDIGTLIQHPELVSLLFP